MIKDWDSLSRSEKKKEAQKTLRKLERKKKLKAWLNKLFNSKPQYLILNPNQDAYVKKKFNFG